MPSRTIRISLVYDEPVQLDEMCPVCLFDAVLLCRYWILRDAGVASKELRRCAICAQRARDNPESDTP